jgi:hypothetical protein
MYDYFMYEALLTSSAMNFWIYNCMLSIGPVGGEVVRGGTWTFPPDIPPDYMLVERMSCLTAINVNC